MTRNIELYLRDIWESVLAIEEYTQGLPRRIFMQAVRFRTRYSGGWR